MMEPKRPNQRPRKLDTQGIRQLVLALAVSSTIGFWALFSRFEDGIFAKSEASAPNAVESQLVEEGEPVLVNLPPIPTLVPTLDPSIAAPAVVSGLPSPSRVSSTLPTPAVIKLPGTKERSEPKEKVVKQKKRKETTTTTQSSK